MYVRAIGQSIRYVVARSSHPCIGRQWAGCLYGRDGFDLRRYIESKAITHTSRDFDASLERAKRHFAQGDAHLFLCDGEPCQQRRRFEATSKALQHEAERIGCRISPTACQGPCKQAPVALLRVGHGCEFFAQFVHHREWEAVLDFVQRAAQAKTLLVDAGTAQPFRLRSRP